MKFTDLVRQAVCENTFENNIEKNSLGAAGSIATNSGVYDSAATGTTATVLRSYSGTSLGSFAMASTGSATSASSNSGGECDLTDSKILKKRKLVLPTKNFKLKKA